MLFIIFILPIFVMRFIKVVITETSNICGMYSTCWLLFFFVIIIVYNCMLAHLSAIIGALDRWSGHWIGDRNMDTWSLFTRVLVRFANLCSCLLPALRILAVLVDSLYIITGTVRSFLFLVAYSLNLNILSWFSLHYNKLIQSVLSYSTTCR